MAPGIRSKFGELEVLRKQIYCIEESTCDIAGTFRRLSQRLGGRGVVPLFVTPLDAYKYALLITS